MSALVKSRCPKFFLDQDLVSWVGSFSSTLLRPLVVFQCFQCGLSFVHWFQCDSLALVSNPCILHEIPVDWLWTLLLIQALSSFLNLKSWLPLFGMHVNDGCAWNLWIRVASLKLCKKMVEHHMRKERFKKKMSSAKIYASFSSYLTVISIFSSNILHTAPDPSNDPSLVHLCELSCCQCFVVP